MNNKKNIAILIGLIAAGLLLLAAAIFLGTSGSPDSQPAPSPSASAAPEPTVTPVPTLEPTYDDEGNLINPPTISREEYERIDKGISYRQLCEIIGGEGKIQKEIDKPGDKYYTVVYVFEGDLPDTSASFILQGDRLKSKAQTGLIPKEEKTNS